MARRKLSRTSVGDYDVSVYRDSEWSEYVVVIRSRFGVGTYHTDDRQDADATARAEVAKMQADAEYVADFDARLADAGKVAPEVRSGYVPCDCRDCMETAIASSDTPTFCHDCEAAGCELNAECCSDHAYGADEDSDE